MPYLPLNYEQINVSAGTYSPSTVKAYNNATFVFWERSLFQRACSVLKWTMPEEWQGDTKDFFMYCLLKFGYLTVFKRTSTGLIFQPCTLSGYNLYYQPTNALVSNPSPEIGTLDLKIGSDCELIKLNPDWCGVWDIISYYAERLSALDNAINMSIINSKFAYIIGARNKGASEALKKMLDKINSGEPAVIYDMKLLNDSTDKAEPWQFLERKNLKESYLTTMQLQDMQTILSAFDAEIGIPTVPYQKKERMVQSEADSRQIDSTSRSTTWFETLTSSLNRVYKLYPELENVLTVELRYKPKMEVLDNE